MMDLLSQGGWVLIAILTLSTFVWFIIADRLLALRSEMKQGSDWVESALEKLRWGNTNEMIKICIQHPGAIERMLLSAIEIQKAGREINRQKRRQIVQGESVYLRAHFRIISSTAVVLPLLGLLGTVLGMTKTFGALSLGMLGDTTAGMGEGISQSLITTQAGLVAALPIVLMHGILSSHARRILEEGALALKRMEPITGSEDMCV